MHHHRRLRRAATLLLLGGLGGCTVVGYPSGEGARPAAVPVPVAAADPSVDVPADRPTPRSTPAPPGARSDAGRSYEVFGRRYRILDSADGYRATGLASWYGEAFHGRPTASGETYDMHGISAAHRTLPLHTWVEVHNLDNGRRLTLRVNDRGPFADIGRRILDLSYGAARELGVVGPGLARVEVRALGAEELSERR
ncbi:MAG: septal ring lytic transglycosylase RlpA family protein [Longimicrobiales bacterium]